MSQGFARSGWPRGSEMIISGNVTASATPHTKGSWVEFDASTAQDVAGMWLETANGVGVAATDTSMLLDVGIGAAAAEVVVVSNVCVGAHSGGVTVGAIRFYLPIRIPAGTRVATRIQGAVISDVYTPTVTLAFGGRPAQWGGYSIAETIGVDTATSGPTTGDLADNAWDEAVASTANAYRALTFHPCLPPGSTAVSSNTNIILDVGVGAGGSEVSLGSWRAATSANETIMEFTGPDFIEKAIPAGSRLAIRKNVTADFSGALIGWR